MAPKFGDPSDPLYLHHSDQPGLVLVSQTLTEENYSTWSHSMTMALTVKNKHGFIDGSVKQPKDDEADKLRQWTRCCNLVKSWLLSSVSKEIAASVFYCDGPQELWNELKERFSQVNGVQLFHIENQIHSCVQDTMSVGSYFTKLKGLWDERDVICPISSCHCEARKEELSYRETQKTIKFLMGLTDSFEAMRGQILAMDPLPKVNKAYSLVLRHEQQRDVSNGKSKAPPEASVFAAKETSKGDGNYASVFAAKETSKGGGNYKCAKCNKTNHRTENCRAHLKCAHCGWSGHTIDYCRKLKGIQSDQQINNQKSTTSRGNFTTASQQQEVSNFPFTKDQCEQILGMLSNRKSPMANLVGNSAISDELMGKAFCFSSQGKKSMWILDSGATDQIVCCPELLTTLKPVKNKIVELLDGFRANVTHIGQVAFSSSLVLDNVLCVPAFNFNLISLFIK